MFPSYLTKDLSRAIASNLTAMKLLVTNIQADAEISGSSAVDIVERAVYYLKEKGRLPLPVPSLITHYIINDPRVPETDEATAYVPLGRLDTLEDPRLVRIGHYEDGVSGRHDASKVLTPFLNTFLSQRRRQRVAVWLYDAASLNKLSQSVLEMLRGGIQDLAVDVTVFYTAETDLDEAFMQPLPISLRNLKHAGEPAGTAFRLALAEREFDYAVLFDSSGMYRGEDLAAIISPLLDGTARCRLGQPAPLAQGHRSLVPTSIQPQRRPRLDQLRRKPRAERGVSGSVRPIHLRHAVGRSRRSRVVPDELAGVAGRQTRESVSSLGASRGESRRARDARAVSRAVARARASNDPGRRTSVAGAHRLAADYAKPAAARPCSASSGRPESVAACTILIPS